MKKQELRIILDKTYVVDCTNDTCQYMSKTEYGYCTLKRINLSNEGKCMQYNFTRGGVP